MNIRKPSSVFGKSAFSFCLVVLSFNLSAHESDSKNSSSQRYTDTTTVAPPDTSNFMGSLYEINDFMEWYIKYFPTPYGAYRKETSWLLGLSKYNAFTIRKGDDTDTITQPSSLSFLGYYTGNDQYKFVLESDIMLNKNRALWRSSIIYSYFPLEYFGVGNNTSYSDRRILNTSSFHFKSEYLFRFYKKWFVGPVFNHYNFYEVSIEEDSEPLPSDSIYLTNNIGKQTGFGIKLLMEGRDNRLNAKKGYYVEAHYTLFDDGFGSEYNYTVFKADIRNYLSPSSKLTIASQLETVLMNGNVPVQSLAFLGGNYSMRGIYQGRYRDKTSIATQTELRFPIFWIFGGTVFGGFGQVAPEYEDLQINGFRLAYGAGLRLKVDSKNNVNLRFDIGHSKDQTVFIINFSEAF